MVKPSPQMQGDIIDFASDVPLAHRFSVIDATADWLEAQHEEHPSDEYAYKALRVAHHLRKQVGYLSLQEVPERRFRGES